MKIIKVYLASGTELEEIVFHRVCLKPVFFKVTQQS
jgi:hypothetical protein